MGQPSTSAQIRAVAIKEAVASFPSENSNILQDQAQTARILDRAEVFASYIENGVQEDA